MKDLDFGKKQQSTKKQQKHRLEAVLTAKEVLGQTDVGVVDCF